MLNFETASAYVQTKETEWYGSTDTVLECSERDDDGVPMIRVLTTTNLWDVWVELDGAIYGEC